MSTIEHEPSNIIDFHKKRREIVIKEVIKANSLPQEDVKRIISMHDFLTQVDYDMRNNLIDKETADKIEEQIKFVREKFDELFEIIKEELFI